MAPRAHRHSRSFSHDQELLLSPGSSSGQRSPLKPLLLTHYHHHHRGSSLEDIQQIKDAHREDAIIKGHIRRLRLVSRTLAFIISVAVLVPISLTLVKFLHTQNTYRDVTNAKGEIVTRTAWAKDTRAWPSWMYFIVAAASVVLNFGTIFSYKYGVEKANTASYVASVFSWVIMIGNLVVWIVAAGLYRTEKDKNGKSNDLWGWTCSAGARAIQKEFAGEIDFNKFCNVQSISWYIGLVQVGASLLTVFIYMLVLRRKKTKKNVDEQMRLRGFEPTRQ